MEFVAVYVRENEIQAWKFERVADRIVAESDAEVAKNFKTQTLIMDVRLLLPMYLDSTQTIVTGMQVVK